MPKITNSPPHVGGYAIRLHSSFLSERLRIDFCRVAKTNYIELGEGKRAEQIPILYEDRSVIAIDKPAGWMLVPFSWQKTTRNLQAAITSSIGARSFWAKSRNLKFLQFIHRLDADTTGILLFGKSPGAVRTFGDLFETRRMEKIYLAIVEGVPKNAEWTCNLKLAPNPSEIGKVKVDPRNGKSAETSFKVLGSREGRTLIEAHPVTGRTHQIRVHLAESGFPIAGDPLYGSGAKLTKKEQPRFPIGLRAVFLGFTNPFDRRRVQIEAPSEDFLSEFGFDP